MTSRPISSLGLASVQCIISILLFDLFCTTREQTLASTHLKSLCKGGSGIAVFGWLWCILLTLLWLIATLLFQIIIIIEINKI